MLTLRDLSRRYAGAAVPAVRGVSLEVAEGEILALVGESGSGKTTVLRLVAGLETPDQGEILLDGERVAGADGRDWVPPEKRQVGLVFQDGALFPHLSVAKNAGYGLTAAHGSRLERSQRVDAMLELTGLGELRDRFPHQLSGGERQRLAVARALAPDPRIILLDEPFSNLDPSLRRSLRDEILAILREAGTTAMMVTHDTEDALAIGDRIAVIRDGRLEQVGTPQELYRHPNNGYCARLFGPANRVKVGGSGTLWLRPEQMRLVDQDAGTNCHAVRLLQVRDTGRRIEARVRCSEDEEIWTVLASAGLPLREGDRAWVVVVDD